MELVKFISYGILSNIICCLGILCNTLTLYILNASKDMRKPSINIYLTVLAIYDNGVLIFSVLMLNIPAITDYHLMLQQQQQQQMTSIMFQNQTSEIGHNQIKTQTTNAAVDAIGNQTSMILAAAVAANDPSPKIDLNVNDNYSKLKITSSNPTGLINSTWIITDSHYNHEDPIGSTTPIVPQQHDFQPNLEYNNDFSQTLNMIMESFKTQCLTEYRSNGANSSSENVQYSNQAQFHSIYCQLLFTLNNDDVEDDDDETGNSKSTPKPFENLIIQPNVQCESILNQLIELLSQLDQEEEDGHKLSRLGIISVDVNRTNHLLHDMFMLLKSIPVLILEQNHQQQQPSNTTVFYDQLCRSNECPSVDYPLSPLVYYVKIVYPLALIAQTGSIWTTCLITIERYLAVCYPLMTMTLSTRARAIWALSILSILAILFNLPRFAEVDTTCYQVRATKFRRNKIYYQVYYIFLNLSLNYILPLSLLSALNIKIYASVRKASTNRSQLTRARQSELHMASMLVAIVAIFIACNAPAFIVNCLEPYFEVGTPVLELVTIFSNVLVCLNSSINFVIYCIFGRKFRLKFIKLLRLHRLIVCLRRINYSRSRGHSIRSTRCGVTFEAASCTIHPDLNSIKPCTANSEEHQNQQKYLQNQPHNGSLTDLTMLKSNRQRHTNQLTTKFDWSNSDATNDSSNDHKNGYNNSNYFTSNNIMIVDMNNIEAKNTKEEPENDDHNPNVYCDNLNNKNVHYDIGDGTCSEFPNKRKYHSKNFALTDQIAQKPLLPNPKNSSLPQQKTSTNDNYDIDDSNNHNFNTFV